MKIDEFAREELYVRVGFRHLAYESKQIAKNCSVYDTSDSVISGVARWRHQWKCVTLRMAPLR